MCAWCNCWVGGHKYYHFSHLCTCTRTHTHTSAHARTRRLDFQIPQTASLSITHTINKGGLNGQTHSTLSFYINRDRRRALCAPTFSLTLVFRRLSVNCLVFQTHIYTYMLMGMLFVYGERRLGAK